MSVEINNLPWISKSIFSVSLILSKVEEFLYSPLNNLLHPQNHADHFLSNNSGLCTWMY